MQAAVALAAKGRWLESADQLAALAQQAASPVIMGNLAILQSWLAQVEQATASWKNYAAMDLLDPDQAVEAEAIGQLIDPKADFTTVALVCHTLEIDDVDSFVAIFSANRQTEVLGDTQAARFKKKDNHHPDVCFYF